MKAKWIGLRNAGEAAGSRPWLVSQSVRALAPLKHGAQRTLCYPKKLGGGFLGGSGRSVRVGGSLRKTTTVSPSPLLAVNYYRPRRPGPEQELEDRLLASLSSVLDDAKEWWLGSSLPLGAGLPDLIAAWDDGALHGVDELGQESVEVLAYLRVVGQARMETVAQSLQFPLHVAEATATLLAEAGAIEENSGPLALTPTWRQVLPEVVAVELKVSDWRGALSQAVRNLLFAHRSFVAFPVDLARRVRTAPEFGLLGVGIIAVADKGEVRVSRCARRSPPRSWRYYYELAARVAKSGTTLALPSPD